MSLAISPLIYSAINAVLIVGAINTARSEYLYPNRHKSNKIVER